MIVFLYTTSQNLHTYAQGRVRVFRILYTTQSADTYMCRHHFLILN